jgi:hypothetical protein
VAPTRLHQRARRGKYSESVFQRASRLRNSMFRDSRWLRSLSLALLASSAQAQASTGSPKEIGEIVQTALQIVIPAQDPPGSHPVADVAGREIRLDYGRTMVAFGLANSTDVRTKLGLTHAEGSRALLDGCDQMGAGSCERLGRSAYTYVEPVSISHTEATVRVHVIWANRPSKRTYMSVWVTEVILTRSGAGPWKFRKLRNGMIS